MSNVVTNENLNNPTNNITPDEILQVDNSKMVYDNRVEEEIVMENPAHGAIQNNENNDGSLSSTEILTHEILQKNKNNADPIHLRESLTHETPQYNKNIDDSLTSSEEFEIRKGSTNDMIIKGLYVQTNDYLVVAYTPPRKWTLEEQIKMLNIHYKSQLRQIKFLNKENERFLREMRKYDRVLYNMSELQTENRYLMTELRIYKLESKLKNKRRKCKLKEEEISGQKKDIIEV